jgi:low affinity Fe/Cu permease
MLRTVLIVILILMLLGSAPLWPYSQGWGYYPSGGLGVILLVVIIVLLSRRA